MLFFFLTAFIFNSHLAPQLKRNVLDKFTAQILFIVWVLPQSENENIGWDHKPLHIKCHCIC